MLLPVEVPGVAFFLFLGNLLRILRKMYFFVQ